MESARAVRADAEERELMRSHFESRVRQLGWFYLFLLIDHDIEYSVAAFANKMLMARDQRIEMLRPAEHQDLQLIVGNQLLQIAVYGAETDVGQFFSHPMVHLIGRGMRRIVLDGMPNQLELPGISGLTTRTCHR